MPSGNCRFVPSVDGELRLSNDIVGTRVRLDVNVWIAVGRGDERVIEAIDGLVDDR